MAAHQDRRTYIHMTVDECRSYVRWWLERSGLTPAQVREVASGIWLDRLVDVTGESLEGSAAANGPAASQQPTAVLPGRRLSERDARGRRSGRFVGARHTSAEADSTPYGREPASAERAEQVPHRVVRVAWRSQQFASQRGPQEAVS